MFAIGFKRDGLDVGPPTRDFGVWVRSLDGGRVVLESEGPQQMLGHPGTIGLYWDKGYARVGDVTDVVGLRITRNYEPVHGGPPPVCSDPSLANCHQVDLESYVFPNDPGDRNLGFEEFTFASPLGDLGGWLIPSGDRRRWAIHAHGWKAERREAIRMLPPYHSAGITSVIVDYRNDPDSPRDPTGHYRFGLSEWEDVEAAVTYAMGEGAEEIILAGYSTGGGMLMSFLEQSSLAKHISAVVLDAPNINLADVVRANTQDARIPLINIRMGQLMKELGMWIAHLLWKVDWDRTNYVQRVDQFLEVPTLVFHGTSDQRVPIAISRQLEARAPQLVTLVETAAAGHVMSWNANPEAYERRLTRFLSTL